MTGGGIDHDRMAPRCIDMSSGHHRPKRIVRVSTSGSIAAVEVPSRRIAHTRLVRRVSPQPAHAAAYTPLQSDCRTVRVCRTVTELSSTCALLGPSGGFGRVTSSTPPSQLVELPDMPSTRSDVLDASEAPLKHTCKSVSSTRHDTADMKAGTSDERWADRWSGSWAVNQLRYDSRVGEAVRCGGGVESS
jgi:hypothetical protein